MRKVGSQDQKMRSVIFIFVWILIFSILFNYVGGQNICPKGCICIHSSVQCINQSLVTIPQVPANTASINLHSNKIKVIPPNAFMDSYQLQKLILSGNEINTIQSDSLKGLTSLKQLNLNFNQLTTIHKESLNDLMNLEILHIENNLIREIEPFTFNKLKNLQILNLRTNHLQRILPNTFHGLERIHKIYLSENQIELIAEGDFSNLTTLKGLYMKGNRIRKISPRAFKGLHQLEDLQLENNNIQEIDLMTFSSLHGLQRLFLSGNKIITLQSGLFNKLIDLKRLRLDNNPIHCDCGVASLLLMQSKPTEYISLVCEGPDKFMNKPFSMLKDDDFNCNIAHAIEKPYDMTMFAGETVELPCIMNANPMPEIIWLHNARKISETKRMKIASSGNLFISPIQSNDVGTYQCLGQTDFGQIKSLPIKIDVSMKDKSPNEEDEPHFESAPKDTTIGVDGIAVFDCIASGMPPPAVKWYFKNREISEPTETMRILANGSLEIFSATLQDAGTYKCEAMNRLKSIQAEAKLDIKELPVFIRTPESLNLKKGQTLILECDAEGNPLPTITWTYNGQNIITNNRISLESENTELIIEDTKYSDSGKYKCVATNENGESESEAIISIEDIQGPPKIIFGPYDLVAISGTTIEIPCKGDDEYVQIQWQKDGRIITNHGRFQISSSGSLYVKNATLSDSGRYECSIKNDHGRATESGLVTIRSNEVLAPGDRYVRVAFAEASKEIDLAINNTVTMLFSNRSQSNPLHHSELLRLFRFPKGEARQVARAAEIYERTLVNIRKHVQEGRNLAIESNQYEYNDLLSREHLRLVAELSGCMEYREMPNCTDMCFHSRYRTVDGTCNNLNNPTWGASLTAFRRIEKPIYENGFSMPIGWMKGKLYAGFPKPSARLISTNLISTKNITPDERLTHMVMQWGQFLDHDLDHAIPSVSSESWDGVDCKKTCEFASPCYPIEVPPNDPRVKNRRCIDLVRSSAICGSGMTSVFFDSIQQREQINQLTSFIDASQVYGYTIDFAEELRNLTTEDGLLRTGVHFPNQKEMLPFTAPQYGVDCRRNLDENNMNCFVAGDIRANEQVGLLAMHTIWMREHNRIAIKLKEINPHWDGDTIYQEARKIVGAQMQHITYKHWLPLIIGTGGMEKLGEYKGYNPSINPSIANEFATAAFRFGHTLINPILHRLNKTYQPIPQGHLPLHKAFFAPWRLAYEGGVDPLMRGFFTVPAKLKKPDQNLNTELTEKLFLTSHAVALDLAAINIQRGRDHGIPGYNEYRKFCNLTVANTFEDLVNEISNAKIRQKLKDIYGHPDNIDIFVGGILEDPVEDGKIGPLFQCILIDQFRKLRDGDRFFYENPSVFLPDQLQQIKQANLGRVLCDNGDDITEVTDNVFLLPMKQGGYKNCLDIQGINLYFWQDCGSCDSVPALIKTYVPDTYPKRNKRSISHSSPYLESHKYTEFSQYKRDTTEKINQLEETISDFQKTFNKLHEKIRAIEQSCTSKEE